jgi:aminoglycoside 6-adenylyltransferase
MKDGHFAYLMQFMDGNRIDLTLFPLAKLPKYETESLSVTLLDKDGILPPLPPPSEQDYLPKPPTAKAFADCCNEFWWVSTYVAKGLWRGEILYAKTLMEQALREQLMKMLTWYVGMPNSFTRSAGKMGKHFKAQLAPEVWAMVEQTYADAGYANTWDALLTLCALFRKVALPIAAHFGFDYPHGDDKRVSAHLRHVRTLPPDATEIY